MKKYIIIIVAILILLIGVFMISSNLKKTENKIATFEDLQDKKIGVLIGGIDETLAQERFPNAELVYFNEQMDEVTALKAGQIDGTIITYPSAFLYKKNIDGITYIDEPMTDSKAGVGIKKGNTDLLNKVNEGIKELKEKGTLDEMINRWYNANDTEYVMPDIEEITEGEPITIGVVADMEPACFLNSNGEVIGLDGELARRLALYLNRPVQFTEMKFGSLVPALESGKIDMIISGLLITEERKQSIEMSDPYVDMPFMMVIRDDG